MLAVSWLVNRVIRVLRHAFDNAREVHCYVRENAYLPAKWFVSLSFQEKLFSFSSYVLPITTVPQDVFFRFLPLVCELLK